MERLCDLEGFSLQGPSTISIGVFDGVHLGHRYLIEKLMESARRSGHLAGVVTFDRHPNELLVPHKQIRYLTTLEKKLDLLGELGLDFTVALPFTGELAETPARSFVSALVEHLQMRELWIGPDFALGRARQGDAHYLKSLTPELGFLLYHLEPLTRSGAVISSSSIRSLIREGRVREAAALLGRYPCVSGEVTYGAHRGHRLGFPTANVSVDDRLMIPATGVYAARVHWDSGNRGSVVNVGTRPTFENRTQPVVEAHILDFDGDLYGRQLEVEFVERLRPEERFENAEALIAQMKRDAIQARAVLDRAEA
jgi:riboflavin kinase/FMN adenylyltransferase